MDATLKKNLFLGICCKKVLENEKTKTKILEKSGKIDQSEKVGTTMLHLAKFQSAAIRKKNESEPTTVDQVGGEFQSKTSIIIQLLSF